MSLTVSWALAVACSPGRISDKRSAPDDPQGASPSPTPESTNKTGALQISLSQELSSSISSALVESGLTDAQAQAVTTEVKATGVIAIDTGAAGLAAEPGLSLNAPGSHINLSDYSLAEQTSALQTTAPSVAGSYVASLDAPAAGLSEEIRKNAIGIVTKATFDFTGKKAVDESSRSAILGDITQKVVEKTSEASLSPELLEDAVGVIADATFSNMERAGIPASFIGDTAKTLGAKIGEGLSKSGIQADRLPMALGKASEKASTALGKLSLSDPVTAIGSTTEGFVAGLAANASVSREIRMAAIAEVPKGISTAVPAWLPADKLENAVAQVTTSSFTTFINKLSPSAAEISDQAPRLAESSVTGLTRSGATAATLAASNVTAKPFQAIVDKMDSVGIDSTTRLKIVENTLSKSISALASSTDSNKLSTVAPQLVSRAFEVATSSRAKLGIDQTEGKVTSFYDTLLNGAIGGLAKAGSTQQAGTASAASSVLAKTMDAAVSSLNSMYTGTGAAISENILKSIPARAAQSAGEKLATVLPPDDLNGAFATVTTQYLFNVQSVVVTKATHVDVSDLTKKVTATSLASFSGAFNARPVDMQTAVTALNNKLGNVGSAMDSKMLAAVQGGSQEVVLQAQERVSAIPSCDGLTDPDSTLIACTKPESASCPTRATPYQGYRLSWQPDATGTRCFLYRELFVDSSAAGISCDSSSDYVYGIGCRPKVMSCSSGQTFVYGIGCRSTSFFCPAGQKFTTDQGCVADSATYSCPSGQRLSANGTCVAIVAQCAAGQLWVASGSGGSCTLSTTVPQCPAGSTYSSEGGKCVLTSVASSGSTGACGSGFYRSSSGTCRPFGACDPGSYWDPASISCKASTTCASPMVWDNGTNTCRPAINTVVTSCPDGQIWKNNACTSCAEGTSWDSVAKICRALGACSPGYVFDPEKNSCVIPTAIACNNDKSTPDAPIFNTSVSLIGGIQLNWTGSADGFLLVRRPKESSATSLTDDKQYEPRSSLGAGVVVYRGNGQSFTDFEAKDADITYLYELWAANIKCTGPSYSTSTVLTASPLAPVTISSVGTLSPPSALTATPVPGSANPYKSAGVRLSWDRASSIVDPLQPPVGASSYVLVRHPPIIPPAVIPSAPTLSATLAYRGATLPNAWTVVFAGENNIFFDQEAAYNQPYIYAVVAMYRSASGPLFVTQSDVVTNPVATTSGGTGPAFAAISLSGPALNKWINRFELNNKNTTPLVTGLVASGHDANLVAYAVAEMSYACDSKSVSDAYEPIHPSLLDVASDLVDGSGYRVCVRLTSEDGQIAYGSSEVFFVDTTSPALLLSGSDSISVSTSALAMPTITTDGTAQRLQWSKVSGPGTAFFTAPNSLNTSVTLGAAGFYTLRLDVWDKAQNVSWQEFNVNFAAAASGGVATLSQIDVQGPSRILTGLCSNPFIIQLKDGQGNAVSVSESQTVGIFGENVTPYADAYCTREVTNLTLNAGMSSAIFYVRARAGTSNMANLGLAVVTSDGTTVSTSRTLTIGRIYRVGVASSGTVSSATDLASELPIISVLGASSWSYAVVKSPNQCDRTLSYISDTPTAKNALQNGDGTYRICVRVSDNNQLVYGVSEDIVVSTASAGDQYMLALEGAPFTKPDSCYPLQIGLKNTSDNFVDPGASGLTVNLPTGITGVTYYADSNCSISLVGSSTTIASGSTIKHIYLKTTISTPSSFGLSVGTSYSGKMLSQTRTVQVIKVQLTGPASDASIVSSEKTSTNPIFSVSGFLRETPIAYALIDSISACNTGTIATFNSLSSPIPSPQNLFTASSGSYKICVRVGTTSPAVLYLTTPEITVDATSGGGGDQLALMGPTLIASGRCVAQSVELRDSTNVKKNPTAPLTVSLSSVSTELQLFSDGSCSTPSANVTIPTTGSPATFYVAASQNAQGNISLTGSSGSMSTSRSLQVIQIKLINAASDNSISSTEKTSTNPLIQVLNIPAGISYSYKETTSSCASVTSGYLNPGATPPTPYNLFSTVSGTYRLCLRITDGTSPDFIYGETPSFTVAGLTADGTNTPTKITWNGESVSFSNVCVPQSIRLLNDSNVLVNVLSNTIVNLSRSGASVNFFSDSACLNSIGTVTVPMGQNSAQIYTRAPSGSFGTATLTATAGTVSGSQSLKFVDIVEINAASDLSVTDAESTQTTDLLRLDGVPTGFTPSYYVGLPTVACTGPGTATLTFTSQVPLPSRLASGGNIICVKLSDSNTTAYGPSQTITRTTSINTNPDQLQLTGVNTLIPDICHPQEVKLFRAGSTATYASTTSVALSPPTGVSLYSDSSCTSALGSSSLSMAAGQSAAFVFAKASSSFSSGTLGANNSAGLSISKSINAFAANLSGAAADSTITSGDRSDTSPIIALSNTPANMTPTFAVVNSSVTCGATLTYLSSIPTPSSVSTTASTYKICVRLMASSGSGPTYFVSSAALTVPSTAKYLDIGGGSETILPSSCVGFTLTSRNADGTLVSVGTINLPVALMVDTAATTKNIIYLNSGCTTLASFQAPSTSTINIPANSNSVTFYVKTSDNDWFTLRAQTTGYLEGLRQFAVPTGNPSGIQTKASRAVFDRGQCQAISIGISNGSGKPAALGSGLAVNLAQTGSASFFATSDCSGAVISSINIPAGMAWQPVYIWVHESEDLLIFADSSGGWKSVLSVSAGHRIFAGRQHTCSVNNLGEARCWGANTSGQLGDGTTTNVSSIPATALSISGRQVKTMALGGNFTCALLDNNDVKCWGANGMGQLGLNDTTQRINPPNSSINFGTGRSARAITAGDAHACAILDDLSLRCWGAGANGRLGNGTSTNQFTPSTVNLGAGVQGKSVKAGNAHTCAILMDNSVKCWGSGSFGQLGNGMTTDLMAPPGGSIQSGGTTLTVKALALGSQHSCAIAISGSVVCWGNHASGQLGIGSGVSSYSTPLTVTLDDGETAKFLSLGAQHSCIVLSTHNVKCFGNNGAGRVFRGDSTTLFNYPIPIAPDINGATILAASIALGSSHTCASNVSTNTIMCWGDNASGQLGSTNLTLMNVNTDTVLLP